LSQPTTFKDISIFQIHQNDVKNIQRLVNGSNPKGHNPVFCCKLDEKINENFINKIEKVLPSRISGDLVDLSDMKFDDGKPIQPPFYLSGTFILFYAAVYCAENHILKNIHRISLESNYLREFNLDICGNIKNFFPNVEFVSLANNRLKKANPVSGLTFIFQPNDPRFIGTSQEDSLVIIPQIPTSYVWNEKGPISAQQPLEVVCGTPFIEQPQPTIYDIESAVVDPSEDLVQDLLGRWIESHCDDFRGICNFYAPTAVFTPSVESCAPDSPLQRFIPFSRNMLNDTSKCNIVQGKDEIQESLSFVFGENFRIVATDFTYEVLFNGLYGLTLTGYCSLDDGVLFNFYRTCAIGYDGESILITNDQMHIRMPKE
jgi:hypothetical protein